jgi:predicted ATPase
VADPFIRSVVLLREHVEDFAEYPFSIPAVDELSELELDPQVTLFAGENGAGKSTLIEAIAVAAGFNPEGGSRHMQLNTRESHSTLHEYLRLVRGHRSASATLASDRAPKKGSSDLPQRSGRAERRRDGDRLRTGVRSRFALPRR